MVRIGLSAYDIEAIEFNRIAVAADRAGFASLWLGEHLVLPVGFTTEHPSESVPDAKHIKGPVVAPDTALVDPLVQLGAAAAMTERIELATGIFLVPLRHPLAIARSTTTVQDLAEGRFVLGVGFGWLAEEFDALDVPFRQRISRFEEGLEVMRAAWRGGVIEHSGRYFDVHGVLVNDRRVDIPVILGGNSDAALDRAVRIGDGWFASGTPTLEAALALRDGLRRRLDDAGRGDDFRIIMRVADPEPATIEPYLDAGFDDLLVWCDQVWLADLPADERPDHLAEVARRLGCA